ncbi:MAG TPA: hypothetical protein VKT75_03505 [Acidobacteriaceae bacterium]|nr:hypothetical protein [Acidobacteriaceae bacterium]
MIAKDAKMLHFHKKAAAFAVVAVCALASARAQTSANAPIPDVPTLMQQVIAHQRQMESVQENYTFHETDIIQRLNKDGSVKKTDTEEYEIFYVNTHEVRQQIRKNGRELDPGEQKKEQERVTKYVLKAQQTPPGQAPNGQVVISVSKILAMVRVSSPRRETIDNRPTIAFDFVGDPHAKAHGIAEEAARRMSGTIWIDESDRQVRRLVARLDENLHVGFGMVSLSKGSNLVFDQKLVNNELWLPTSADVFFNARAFAVMGMRANVHVTDNDYRKFHAAAQQQSGVTVVQ